MTYVLVLLFLAAAAVSWLSTRQVRRLAERVGAIDRPDARKTHGSDTPRLGGLAIILGFAFPLMLIPLHPHALGLVKKNLDYLLAVLTSGSVIIALGVYDDLYGSNATKKFTVQAVAGALLVAFGFHFDVIFIPGVGNVTLGVFGTVLTVIWVVGVINAVNFIDGMDGLLATVALTVAAAFATIAVLRGDIFTLVIMVALGGSLAGFLPWNRPPARIFMGDSGSMFIGLLLAACSIARASKSPTALVIGGPMLALALPVVDTILVMKKRFQQRHANGVSGRISRMFNADRSHIHHILVGKYGSERRAILYIWVITMLFGVAAIISIIPHLKVYGYVLGGVTLLLMLFLRFSKGIDEADLPDEMKVENPT